MSVSILTLREALAYDRDSGAFAWKERPIHHFSNDNRWSAAQNQKRWNVRYAGRPCFLTLNPNGYLYGCVDGQRLLSHRAAWAIVMGEWPIDTVDHINGNRSDNRWSNLRSATRAEQSRNCAASKSGTSPYLGVSWRTDRKKWRAVIKRDGRQTFLGSFDSEIEAAKAYDEAAKKAHGVFARLNFPS